MKERAKLLFLIPHLGGGGAERVTALYLRNLCPQKYDLHLGLITQSFANPETIPTHVLVHGLDSPRVRGAAFRLLALVWSVQPDLILSGMAHLNFLVLMLRPFFPIKTRMLVRQNSTVSASLAFDQLPWYTGLLYKRLYRHADRIACQTQAMADDLSRRMGIRREKRSCLIAVTPNPIDIVAIRVAVQAPQQQEDPVDTGPGPHFLAVGRLACEKGFELLLRALSLVRQEFPCAELTILGSGPEEAPLKRLARVLNLESSTHFAGYVETPSVYFSHATAFLLSSYHEGLPNALLEAAAAGLPLIVTPSSPGVVELLAGRPGVWIAEAITAEALAASMRSALLALNPGQRFPHPFVEQFGLARSIGVYEALIDTLLATARGKRV